MQDLTEAEDFAQQMTVELNKFIEGRKRTNLEATFLIGVYHTLASNLSVQMNLHGMLEQAKGE